MIKIYDRVTRPGDRRIGEVLNIIGAVALVRYPPGEIIKTEIDALAPVPDDEIRITPEQFDRITDAVLREVIEEEGSENALLFADFVCKTMKERLFP